MKPSVRLEPLAFAVALNSPVQDLRMVARQMAIYWPIIIKKIPRYQKILLYVPSRTKPKSKIRFLIFPL